MEPSRHQVIPSPPVFMYYSNYERSSGSGRDAKMSIAVSEFIVIATVLFLATARDRVNWKTMHDWGIIDRGGVLVRFPVGYHDHVTRSGFLSLVKRSSFDLSLYLMAFERLNDIDWKMGPIWKVKARAEM